MSTRQTKAQLVVRIDELTAQLVAAQARNAELAQQLHAALWQINSRVEECDRVPMPTQQRMPQRVDTNEYPHVDKLGRRFKWSGYNRKTFAPGC